MMNLSIIGWLPALAKKISGNLKSPAATESYNTVVDHALNKFLDSEEFNTVVNGYRRSTWSAEALEYGLHKMDQPEFPVIKDEHYEKAISAIQKIFTPDKPLQPVHFSDLRKYPWPLSSSIGAPFATSPAWIEYTRQKFDGYTSGKPESQFTKPYYRDLFAEAHKGQSLDPPMIDARMTKRNLYNEMFYINRKHIHLWKENRSTNDKGHDLRYWHTAFARQHLVEQDEPDKVRLVFGAPSLSLMAELMFIWPIQAWLLSLGDKSPMLWGYETITGGWYRLVNTIARYLPRFGSVVTLDWSGFDRDARHTIIEDIHSRIFRPMFDFTNGYHPTREYPNTIDTDPIRIENLWNKMCDSILTTPLLMPDGRLIRFSHSGIFSGYFQTQLLDSVYNLVMILTILSRFGFNLDNILIKVQGDDSIVLLLFSFIMISTWFLTMFSHYALLYFGSTLNLKKSDILPSLEGAEVLRYKNKGTMPIRDELQLLAMLRHPERKFTYESLLARTIGIAYANCGAHPRVYQICEDIHAFLSKLNISPDPTGLPEGMRFIKDYVPSHVNIDINSFPSYFDTVKHLTDPHVPQPSEKYWPTSHFIGIPGKI
jgi:hypothetical protein